jgi:ABC-type antimicrobial peptide transport system permease subunit
MTHATRFVPAVAVLVALVGAPVQAQTPEIDDPTIAWDLPNPDLEALRARAEQGDAEAQGDLGFQYAVTQDYAEAVRWYRLAADAISLVAVCAGIALMIAVVGVHGAMNDLVARRRAELALRTALGASAARVVGSVVGSGLRLAGVGLGIGIGAAAIALPILSRVVAGPPRPSLVAVGLAGLVIGLLVIIACAVPAWRAVAIEPREAMQ